MRWIDEGRSPREEATGRLISSEPWEEGGGTDVNNDPKV
jgi:hypothetical protein